MIDYSGIGFGKLEDIMLIMVGMESCGMCSVLVSDDRELLDIKFYVGCCYCFRCLCMGTPV